MHLPFLPPSEGFVPKTKVLGCRALVRGGYPGTDCASYCSIWASATSTGSRLGGKAVCATGVTVAVNLQLTISPRAEGNSNLIHIKREISATHSDLTRHSV